MKRLRIHVEGQTFEVAIELLDQPSSSTAASHAASQATYRPPASIPMQSSAAPIAKPAAKSTQAAPNDITSPLAAVVVSIDVAVGDPIEEGQQVATLEAMKMNTIVNATKGGTVKAIEVNPGDALEEGQVILSVE